MDKLNELDELIEASRERMAIAYTEASIEIVKNYAELRGATSRMGWIGVIFGVIGFFFPISFIISAIGVFRWLQYGNQASAVVELGKEMEIDVVGIYHNGLFKN